MTRVGVISVRSWRSRRALEAAFWIVIIGLFWTLDTLTKMDLRARTGVGLDDFRLITEQWTSAAGVLAMVAFVAFWLRQFPLDRSRPLPTVVGHLAGSALFACGHYAVFVLLRKFVFGLRGIEYMPSQRHFGNLVFEYKKDIKIYLIAVAIIAVYRHFRSQRGAASETEDSRITPPTGSEPRPSKKLAVQTRKGERLLEIDLIDYLEAARNYVEVHADGEQYLVRSPLNRLAARLPAERFLRTHRSFLVNAEAVIELQATNSGSLLVLRSGAEVPVSRGHRDAVRSALERLQV